MSLGIILKVKLTLKKYLRIVLAKLNILDYYFRKAYSQNGEDIMLDRIFNKKKGFYIDIGAHHPLRFSNTHYFYRMGWNGINIDAQPGSMKEFNKIRKRDINIEAAISDVEEELIFYSFNDGALNTFDGHLVTSLKNTKYRIVSKQKISTISLTNVLSQFELPDEIDFMSIDAEGFDLNVIRSNDWSKYRPKIILIEDSDFSFDKATSSEVYNYLSNKDYYVISKAYNTIIFKSKESIIPSIE